MTTALPSVRDDQGRVVALEAEVRRGEQGASYSLRGRPGEAAEVLFEPPNPAQRRKLEAQLRLATPELGELCGWPQAGLYTGGGQPIGFVRPWADLSGLREVSDLYSPERRREAFPQARWGFQVQVARDLTQAFATLHAQGHLMGNVTPSQVWLSPGGQVRLLGAETYQVGDREGGPEGGQAGEGGQVGSEVSYPCPVGTPEFTPPELQGESFGTLLRTPEQEAFGVAVLMFLLLFDGHHPYAGLHENGPYPSPAEAIRAGAYAYADPPRPGLRPPLTVPSPDAMPPEVRALFARAFGPDPAARPDAATWARALDRLLSDLKRCADDPAHEHWAGSPCPWCEVAARPPAALPPAPDALDLPSEEAEVNRLWAQVTRVPAPPPSPALPALPTVQALAPLSLDLPPPPRQNEGVVKVLRWLLRGSVIAVILGVTAVIQNSFLAAIVLGGILLFAFTIGRRFSVDWDGLIARYQAWEKGLLGDGQEEQASVYRRALARERAALRARADELTHRRETLRERYHTGNAAALHARQTLELEAARRRLLDAREREQRAVGKLLRGEQERARLAYLAGQSLRPGALPGLTLRVVTQLAGAGLHTAADVAPERLGGVPAHWARELLGWRQRLEDFFQFDPAQLPTERAAELRRESREQAGRDLTEFRQAVTAFGATDWAAREDELLRELAGVEAELAQVKQALEDLPVPASLS